MADKKITLPAGFLDDFMAAYDNKDEKKLEKLQEQLFTSLKEAGLSDSEIFALKKALKSLLEEGKEEDKVDETQNIILMLLKILGGKSDKADGKIDDGFLIKLFKNDQIDLLKVVLQLLNKSKVDLTSNFNYQNGNGESLLMLACKSGYEDILEPVSNLTRDFNIVDNTGRTAFMRACQFGNLAAVKILMGFVGVNINFKDKNNQTPLMIACMKGDTKLVELLLRDSRTDINATNTAGKTALMLACENNKLDVVKLLVNNPQTDVNIRDSSGRTPLAYAAEKGNIDMVNLLLSHPSIDINKPNVDTKGKLGETPFQIACRLENPEMIAALLQNKNLDLGSRTPDQRATDLAMGKNFGNDNYLNINFTPLADIFAKGNVAILELIFNDPHKRLDVNQVKNFLFKCDNPNPASAAATFKFIMEKNPEKVADTLEKTWKALGGPETIPKEIHKALTDAHSGVKQEMRNAELERKGLEANLIVDKAEERSSSMRFG